MQRGRGATPTNASHQPSPSPTELLQPMLRGALLQFLDELLGSSVMRDFLLQSIKDCIDMELAGGSSQSPTKRAMPLAEGRTEKKRCASETKAGAGGSTFADSLQHDAVLSQGDRAQVLSTREPKRKTRPRERNSELLRIAFLKGFTDEDLHQESGPEAVRVWARRSLPAELGKAIVGVLPGFDVECPEGGMSALVGLIRVRGSFSDPSSPAVRMLQLSGLGGAVVEPLRWQEPLPRVKAKWIPRGKDEAHAQWLERAMQCKPAWGVSRGLRDLCAREPPGPWSMSLSVQSQVSSDCSCKGSDWRCPATQGSIVDSLGTADEAANAVEHFTLWTEDGEEVVAEDERAEAEDEERLVGGASASNTRKRMAALGRSRRMAALFHAGGSDSAPVPGQKEDGCCGTTERDAEGDVYPAGEAEQEVTKVSREDEVTSICGCSCSCESTFSTSVSGSSSSHEGSGTDEESGRQFRVGGRWCRLGKGVLGSM